MHRFAIPALPPVADPAARAYLSSAPAVEPETGSVAPSWFTAAMDSIDARFASTNARLDVLDNAARKVHNALIANRSATQSWLIQTPLSPFVRVNADIGPGHPGKLQVAEKDLPVVALGQEFPSPTFPRTIEALKNMTPENIKMLSMLMNNDFEIEAGDDLDMRRDKLRIFLFYGV